MQGIFITGTSTGVGKTYIGALLAKSLTGKNITVVPRKPIESGCNLVNGELYPSDAGILQQACGYPGPLAEVCPYRFAPAISPARAASLAGQSVTTDQLVQACLHKSQDGFMLIEGAGGFYSPLAEDGLNADLAVALQLPVLLVAENSLGVLNQVLLNAEAIDRRGLDLIAVVLNNLDSEQPPDMDNTSDLKEMLGSNTAVCDYRDTAGLPDELINTIVASAVDSAAVPASTRHFLS
jgi:dethiobiotin synthetase